MPTASHSERMKADLVGKALFMAVKAHKPLPGLIRDFPLGDYF